MPYPGGKAQRTAIFLSIRRKKGEKAAKAWFRKAQREGYAPVAKDDHRKRKHRRRALKRAAGRG